MNRLPDTIKRLYLESQYSFNFAPGLTTEHMLVIALHHHTMYVRTVIIIDTIIIQPFVRT